MQEGNQPYGLVGGDDGLLMPSFVSAAHELKNPMVLVRQLALELETNEQLANHDIQEIAERIRLTSERSLRLTQDLTQSQRLDDMLFNLEPIHPIAICEDIVHELTPLMRARGRLIEVPNRKRSPLIIANRDLLRRILINFADNALQSTTNTEPLKFMMRTSRIDGAVSIMMRDYGPGVSTDVWKRLSGSINHKQAIARRPNSSGLGLYISRQFAEAMNGTIGVTRHHDGASFFVRLPLSTQMRLL
jgi:signal transduction histidine kinase